MKIINLGKHPLADSFLKKSLLKKEKKKSLICYLNKKIGKIYLKSRFPAYYRYNFVNYSYTSSNSNETKSHWINLCKFLDDRYSLKNKKVLEIGSNDGFLLSLIKNKSDNILGVDASRYMVKKSNKKNINTIYGVFSEELAKKIKKKYFNFDIIIANNVMNHIDNMEDFFKGLKKLMYSNSIFIFEVPYWAYQVKVKKFDQIYHEHRIYFTAKYINFLSKKYKFNIDLIKITNFHGQSLRVIFSKKKKSENE